MLSSKVKGTSNLRTRRPIRPNPLIPMADMVGQFKIGLRSESCQRSSILKPRIIVLQQGSGQDFAAAITEKALVENCPLVRHLVNLVLEVQRESLRLVKYVA